MDLAPFIRNIPDFPKPGIQFKDITTLLLEPDAFRHIVDTWTKRYAAMDIDAIVGVDARGFIFGAALAYKMGIGFVPVRKPGKLPYKTRSVSYDLEYGSDTLCMHEDALLKGEKVLVIDDLLATGGTLSGVVKLVEDFGAEIAGIGVVIELSFLNGREQFKTYGCESILQIA